MTDAAKKTSDEKALSELDLKQWSVVSFDECEASGLTYADAVKLLEELETSGVYGLCIVTDDVASKVQKPNR
jgi:hypothetical protein